MATKYRDGKIVMHRGDTILLPIQLNIGTAVNPDYYELTEDDCIYFAIMEPNQDWEWASIKKVYDFNAWRLNNKSCQIYISSEDTESLIEGTYYYQVKLYIKKDPKMLNNESITTIVPKTKFIIIN